MDILDLYVLLPLRKKEIKNGSKEIYKIMTNNRLDTHTHSHLDQGGELNKMLELFWQKLEERFKNIGESYRFLDKNHNNRLSFQEFVEALDNLEIKFSIDMLQKIFNYMDSDDKGYVTYQNFCEMAEERRRGIINMLKPKQNLLDQSNMFKSYLQKADVSELELLGQWSKPKIKLRTTDFTNALVPSYSQLPDRIQKDKEFRFGKASIHLGKNGDYKMEELMTNNYNKKYLEDVI
jgi:hypothetical protein